MKLSRTKHPKKSTNYVQYRTHHEIDMEEDEEIVIVGTVLTVVVGAWWGFVHIIDIFFNKLDNFFDRQIMKIVITGIRKISFTIF